MFVLSIVFVCHLFAVLCMLFVCYVFVEPPVVELRGAEVRDHRVHAELGVLKGQMT